MPETMGLVRILATNRAGDGTRPQIGSIRIGAAQAVQRQGRPLTNHLFKDSSRIKIMIRPKFANRFRNRIDVSTIDRFIIITKCTVNTFSELLPVFLG